MCVTEPAPEGCGWMDGAAERVVEKVAKPVVGVVVVMCRTGALDGGDIFFDE